MQGPPKPTAGEKKTYGVPNPLLNSDEQYEEHSESGLSPQGAGAISSGSPCGLRLPDRAGGSKPGDRLSTRDVCATLPVLLPPSIRRPADPDGTLTPALEYAELEISTPARRFPHLTQISTGGRERYHYWYIRARGFEARSKLSLGLSRHH